MNDVACQAESRGRKAAVNKCKRGHWFQNDLLLQECETGRC